MTTATDSVAAYGYGGRFYWLVGGAAGGLLSSALFGGLLWLVEPTIITETIPAIYGLEPGAAGWGFHLLHGLLLGIGFGLLISRPLVLGTITATVETDPLEALGPGARITMAGIVYGLAIWALLPVIAQTIWITVTGMADTTFPTIAFESLVGHLLWGLVLGAVFSLFVEVRPAARDTAGPFDEPE
ncbi:hypothetical protein OB919_03160 [Halobacteria archaeon AArc-curdl1]|uniref:Histidine kinase n=1 Tax=Natronosalvus hydrolyticus TaxID=2979988 RepID=A0AAP3E5R3_9EURY|nr:hypothetical protein [Halobacteria archaeon AArc-curdl1]